ncbi:hypothetical protein [Sediminibacterium ginsengisoli]|uniref:Uncharacterized protein n=1 Tax=Sediminibacterium ginsengisoli TaxID=413434 RepID=A0A1T4JU60_9BACT|nr:hypothetical protein [Sediminibacterium ginsengisoli]SJZ33645.1 hypothetical protein SAMN04488132_101188 [Sediminibacterium ginsengisoli]
METNSENQLQDFDMCLAISEKAINGGLKTAWAAWKKTKQIKDMLQLRLKNNNGEQTKEGLDVKIAAPTISLSAENAGSLQVQVTLKLESGTVYYNSDKMLAEEKVRNWSFSFVTELGKRKTNLSTLKTADEESYNDAVAIMNNAKANDPSLSESVFSLEYLFLELTHIDITKLKATDIKGVPEDVDNKALTVAKKALNELTKGNMLNKDFMLGTVVRMTPSSFVPTLSLSDYTYGINRASSAPTLDYLGMFGGRQLPRNIETAKKKMPHAWVQPQMLGSTKGSVAGVLVISKNTFMYSYFAPLFKKLLDRSALRTDVSKVYEKALPVLQDNYYTWDYLFETSSVEVRAVDSVRQAILNALERSTIGDILSFSWGILSKIADLIFRINQHSSWTISFKPQPGTNELLFEGNIFVNAAAVLEIEASLLFKSINVEVGSQKIKGTQKFSGTILLEGKADELDGDDMLSQFSVKPKLKDKIKFEKLILDTDSTGYISIQNFIGDALKNTFIPYPSLRDALSATQTAIGAKLANLVNDMIGKFSIDMTNYAFIPPGGGVLLYQRPHFSGSGDLFIDAIYKTPEA